MSRRTSASRRFGRSARQRLRDSSEMRGSDSAMEVYRPAVKDGQSKVFSIVRRDRTRLLSDAEAVVLLHHDSAAAQP